jgi:aminoglycoside 3-N-acetyltransferase I
MIAVSREEVVGGLMAYVLRKFEQERSEICIYDLAVVKAYRRKGVATALIRYLASIAKSCQAWVIFVQADPGGHEAIRLLRAHGERFTILISRSKVSDGNSEITFAT